ncbi:MAG: zinc ribbon domain-containing protein [Oscillospiraceae bacterium]
MKCPKCGFENEDGAAFCGGCGEDLSSENIMSALDESAKQTEARSAKKSGKKKKQKKDKAADGAEKVEKKSKVKAILIAAALLLVLAVAAMLILMNMPSEGEKVLKNVPIGRNLAYAEAKTEETFAKISKYDAVNRFGDFDNICEGNLTIKVEGVSFPEWAIAVTLATDETIDRVTYYDFSALQNNWKGHHSSEKIELTAVEYGMKRKAVDRVLGFTPYSIIKGIDNTVTNVYRYYYSDETTGNDVVCNFCVVFNDVDECVKNVYVNELDYIGFMTSVN